MWAALRFKNIRHGKQPISSDVGYFKRCVIIYNQQRFRKASKQLVAFRILTKYCLTFKSNFISFKHY